MTTQEGAPAPQENTSVQPGQEQTPAPTQQPTPPQGSEVAAAREAELNDIADLLSLGDGNGGAPAPAEEPKVPLDEKPGEQTPAPAPSPGDEKKPESEAKPQQSQELADLLKDALKTVAKEPAAPAQPKAPEPKPEGPKYSPQLPETLFAALEHEDPAVRRQGMNIMIGTAMSRVYADLRAEMTAAIGNAMTQVPQVVQTTQEQQARAVAGRDEFYAANPEFANKGDKFKQFVAMTGLALAQELGQGYKGFDKDFQEKLATRVEEMTGGQVKKGKVAAPPKVLETKPAKPAGQTFQAGASARPAGTGTPTLADEIADTIGLGPSGMTH